MEAQHTTDPTDYDPGCECDDCVAAVADAVAILEERPWDLHKLQYDAGERDSFPLGAPNSALPGYGLVINWPHKATEVTPLGQAVLEKHNIDALLLRDDPRPKRCLVG